MLNSSLRERTEIVDVILRVTIDGQIKKFTGAPDENSVYEDCKKDGFTLIKPM